MLDRNCSSGCQEPFQNFREDSSPQDLNLMNSIRMKLLQRSFLYFKYGHLEPRIPIGTISDI